MYEYLEVKSEGVAKSTFSDLSSTTSTRTAYFGLSFSANMLSFLCTTVTGKTSSPSFATSSGDSYDALFGAVLSSLGVERGVTPP